QPTTQVPNQPQLTLQLRNVHVQIHTVDALHLEHHMISKHISHSTRYCHHQLRSAGSRKANHRTTRSIHRTGPQPVTVTTHRPEPTHPPSPPPHASSGWGEAPLGVTLSLRDWYYEAVRKPAARRDRTRRGPSRHLDHVRCDGGFQTASTSDEELRVRSG